MGDKVVTPLWALTIAYWLHMLATVIWIGGITTVSLFLIPISQKTLSREHYAALIDQIGERLNSIGWFSLALLMVTGLIQMSANPNYGGFLAITNRWGVAILLKHLVFGATIISTAFLTWKVFPALRRSALRRAKGLPTPEEVHNRSQERRLLRLNLALSILILALTALARTA
jgi:uncharacterized membrane protein